MTATAFIANDSRAEASADAPQSFFTARCLCTCFVDPKSLSALFSYLQIDY